MTRDRATRYPPGTRAGGRRAASQARAAGAAREPAAARASARRAARSHGRRRRRRRGRAPARARCSRRSSRSPTRACPSTSRMGALGVFAVGTVVYFWYPAAAAADRWSIRNPPARGRNAGRGARTEAGATPRRRRRRPAAIPGLPAASPLQRPRRRRRPRRPRRRRARRAAARRRFRCRRYSARRRHRGCRHRVRPPAAEITSSRAGAAGASEQSTAGYAAYLAGDLASARTEYQQALREEPANRDALLGIAALECARGRFEDAEAGYLRATAERIRATPTHWRRSSRCAPGALDPVAAESRVKSVLARQSGLARAQFHARQPARATGTLGRGAAGVLQGVHAPSRTTPTSPTTSR